MPFNLADLYIFPFFLVFCRMGGAFMVFPALSDTSVNVRVRLLAALLVSMALWPVVLDSLPSLPNQTATLVGMVVLEVVYGILLAIAARLMMAAINIAGELIAFATGFQAATLFDPATSSNTSAPSLFLLICAGVLVLVTNTHHLLIQATAESYRLFPPGVAPATADVLQAGIQVVQNLSVLGLKMAAPVVSIGFLSYVAFGIFNRLIPSLHVFFVAMPINIAVGLTIMALSLSMMMLMFMSQLQDNAILFDIPALTG